MTDRSTCSRSSGYWLEKGRVPYVTQRRHLANGDSRVRNAILNRVLKRPLVAAAIATGALVAFSVPALGMHLRDPGFDATRAASR
jgi:RND superfamily putative drug exporter